MTTIYSGFSYDPEKKELFFMMTHGSRVILKSEINKFVRAHNNAYQDSGENQDFQQFLVKIAEYLSNNSYKVEKFTWKSDCNLGHEGTAVFPDFLQLENFMKHTQAWLSGASGEMQLFSGNDTIVIASESKYGGNLPEDAPVKVRLTNKAGKPVEDLKKEILSRTATDFVANLMRDFFRGNKVRPENELDQKVHSDARQKPSTHH